MNSHTPFCVLVSAIAAAVVGCMPLQSPAQRQIALVGGTVIDGTGAPAVNDSVVLIRGDRIEAVGTRTSLTIPAGYQQISTTGRTVLPGLWDLHVHLLYAGHTDIQYWQRTYTPRYLGEIMPATAAQLLGAGVTSARDLGAPPGDIFALKRLIQEGRTAGPTLFAAGPQLTRQFPDWAQYYRWAISGEKDASDKASRLLAAGADTLKIVDAAQLDVSEIKAIVAAAHARGKKVTAHGRTLEEIRQALDGGVDEFQHIGLGYTEYPQDILDRLTARAASGNPVSWTITVGLPLNADYLRNQPPIFEDNQNYRGLPPAVVADIKTSLAKFQPQLSAEDAAGIKRKVMQLQTAGVQLLLGTDGGLAGNFHTLSINQEIEAWVNVLRMDPLNVIQYATSISARYMGLADQSGSLAPGKYADIIVVGGNPLQDIKALRNPEIIIKRGNRYR